MNSSPIRILVVDDEVSICELMKINLEIAGYSVDMAHSAEKALSMDLSVYSLMVFDIMMGEMSGLELVTRVRQMEETANTPVIVCTALGDDQPLVDGFTRGADDYIRTPFSMRAFVARVQRLLKKSGAEDGDFVQFKSLKLDNKSKTCFIGDDEVALTKKEYDLLHLLLTHPGKIFSREEILDKVWEKNIYVVDRTIDVNINRLR